MMVSRSTWWKAVAFTTMLILAGCAATPKEKIVKRYASDIPTDEKLEFYDDNIAVEIFPLILPVPQKKVSDFSKMPERAQAAFIEQSAEMHKGNPAKWTASLVNPFKPKKGSSGTKAVDDKSRVTFSRRFLFTVLPDHFLPADRLEKVRITITLPSGLSFVSWSQLANQHETINPGEISLTQTNATEFSLNFATPIPMLPGGSFSASSERSLQEKPNLAFKINTLTGGVKPGKREAFIILKGGLGIDLSGTVYVDTKFKVAKDNLGIDDNFVSFVPLFDDNGPKAPDKVQFSKKRVYYPKNLSGKQEAVITYKINARFVKAGDRTYQEGDDIFWKESSKFPGRGTSSSIIHTNSAQLVLFEENALTAKYFVIKNTRSSRNAGSKDEIIKGQFAAAGGGATDLKFTTYDEAARFVYWLHQSPLKCTGNRVVGAKDNKLTLAFLTTQICRELYVSLQDF